MAKAADLATATMETLQQFRSEEEWSKYIKDMASLHNIEKALLRNTHSQHQRTIPKRLEYVITLQSTGSREMATTNKDYKISSVLDAMMF